MLVQSSSCRPHSAGRSCTRPGRCGKPAAAWADRAATWRRSSKTPTISCAHCGGCGPLDQQRRVSPGPRSRLNFGSVATRSATLQIRSMGERLLGATLHFLGEQTLAREHLERALERDVGPPKTSDIVRFKFDQRVTTRMTLARVLWLQGSPTNRCERSSAPSTTRFRSSTRCRCAMCLDRRHARCDRHWRPCRGGSLRRDADSSRRAPRRRRVGDVWSVLQGHVAHQARPTRPGRAAAQAAVAELRAARFVHYTAFLAGLAEGLAAPARR